MTGIRWLLLLYLLVLTMRKVCLQFDTFLTDKIVIILILQHLRIKKMRGIFGQLFLGQGFRYKPGGIIADKPSQLFYHLLPFLPGEQNLIISAVKYPLKQIFLEFDSSHDALFNTVPGHEIDDIDALTCLSDPVDPANALIHFCRIPGQLKINDTICSLQVQPGPSGI